MPAAVPTVVAVSRSASHTFSKPMALSIRLMAGLGVEGDAHNGTTVKHRSRVERDPTAPNLRQVHLIHSELHAELAGRGFSVGPGEMGENITTAGIDLLALPRDTRLRLGPDAEIRITGLRNPCRQLEAFQPGLQAAVLARDDNDQLVRKAGVMAVVLTSGDVTVGDTIEVVLPDGPHVALEVV